MSFLHSVEGRRERDWGFMSSCLTPLRDTTPPSLARGVNDNPSRRYLRSQSLPQWFIMQLVGLPSSHHRRLQRGWTDGLPRDSASSCWFSVCLQLVLHAPRLPVTVKASIRHLTDPDMDEDAIIP